ncbi:MAG: RecB family exonuclease [Gemmatimonadota bacterium]
MPYDPGPFPEFSWSQTRRSTFRECPRMYYYQYYASHRGWEKDAPEEAKVAYRLKQITNLHLLVGNVIHELASAAIMRARGGVDPPALDELVESGRRRLNQAWAQSQRRAEWELRPRALPMLHEFYYGSGPSGSLIAKIRDKLSTCLRGLLESRSYREAIEAPYVEVKETDRPDTFVLHGHKIYAQPDLLYRVGGGEYRLVDWKTGEEREGDVRQLRAYAVYFRHRADLESGPIIGCLEYLYTGGRQTAPITEEGIDAEERAILDSMERMQAYLVDADKNEPLPKSEFPIRTDTTACGSCKFYELDAEEIAAAPAGPF